MNPKRYIIAKCLGCGRKKRIYVGEKMPPVGTIIRTVQECLYCGTLVVAFDYYKEEIKDER